MGRDPVLYLPTKRGNAGARLKEKPRGINNSDYARFVLEHPKLLKKWQESGLTRHQFITKHRSQIHAAMRASQPAAGEPSQ